LTAIFNTKEFPPNAAGKIKQQVASAIKILDPDWERPDNYERLKQIREKK